MRDTILSTLLLVTFSFISVPVSAAAISVFGTGLDASGHFLAPGSSDPHYALTLNYLGTGSNGVVAQGANPSEAVAEGVPLGWPLLPGLWVTDPLAQWIAPQGDLAAIHGVAMDTFYTYQTTFDLTGFDLSTVELDGHWTADNYLSNVSLNGAQVYAGSGCGYPGNWTWQGMSPFSLTSGFVPGVNTLSFDVTNATCVNTPPHANPTGLLVDISGTGTPMASAPEPGTTISSFLGLVIAVSFYRKRRNA